MKKRCFVLLQQIHCLAITLVLSSCAWGATPTPLPPPTPEPPPPGKIVYVSIREGYVNQEIYLMDTDGSNQLNLTQDPANDYDPAWAPDGRRIVFTSRRYGRGQLMIIDLETHDTYRLKGPVTAETNVALLREDSDPAWSPDGQWIAYTSSTLGGEIDIYKIRSDGTEETRLTNHKAPDSQPTWSPDSRQIAFVSWREDGPEVRYLSPNEKNIFIMNADGSQVRRFTDDRQTENEAPRWSQDGQSMLYTARREPGYRTSRPHDDVLLIRQEIISQQREQLLQTSNPSMTADLSPDREWLVFDGWLVPERYLKICFVQVSGQNYQCINVPGIYPRWQPSSSP